MKDLIWLISEISVTDRMKGLSNVDPNLMEWHCSLSSTTATDEKRIERFFILSKSVP